MQMKPLENIIPKIPITKFSHFAKLRPKSMLDKMLLVLLFKYLGLKFHTIEE